MCSITWVREQSNVVVRFNRDEQRSRALGSPPVRFSVGGITILAPTDPASGGTWIALNALGVVFALLNHHAKTDPANPASRGLLIPSLAMAGSAHEALALLRDRPLGSFRPFQLVVVERSGKAKAALWNGLDLLPADVSGGMLSSSSHEPERVLENRRKAWAGLAGTVKGPDSFHAWRDPLDGASSVLMSRPDARTVSRSRIVMGASTANFFHEDLDDAGLVTSLRVHHLALTHT